MTNNIISITERKKSRKRYTRSLEYELIASLAFQQYTDKDEPKYAALLSIPLGERIPGLMDEYGLQRMHRLLKTILTEFSTGIPLPKTKKLTETRLSVVACELILIAEEDQFSMEDYIVFFELAKKGRWGKFQGMLTHFGIMQKLEQYRQERYTAYQRIVEEREAEVRLLGPLERISPEPTPIKQLFEQTGKIIPFKKIS